MIESNVPEVNVDEIMQKIRDEVAKRKPRVEFNVSSPDVQSSGNFIKYQYIESLLNNAKSRASIRSSLPDKFNRIPFNIGKKIEKLILKVFNLLFKDQREVNFNLIQSLRESVALNEQLTEQVNTLKAQMQAYLISIESRVQALQQHLNTTDGGVQQVNAGLGTMEGSVQQVDARLGTVESSVQQIDAGLGTVESSVQQVDARLSTVESSLQNMHNSFNTLDKCYQHMNESYLRNDSYLKNDLAQQKHLLALFLQEALRPLPEPFSQEKLQKFVDESKHSLDAFYAAFEDHFRGSREDIYNRLKVYLPLIEETKLGFADAPILDVGCGRGEWLELLREHAYSATGIDVNRVMLEQCRNKGLEAIEEDVIKYMQSLPDESLGVVTGFHIIEHLPFEKILQLFTETLRVLKPQGLVIFETPNPENVLVGSHNFYVDPTHRNPLPSITTKFIAETIGLCRVNILKLHPYPESQKLGGSDLAERFNDYFYGAQDYAVVGYKP